MVSILYIKRIIQMLFFWLCNVIFWDLYLPMLSSIDQSFPLWCCIPLCDCLRFSSGAFWGVSFIFWDRLSRCVPGWPRTHCVDLVASNSQTSSCICLCSVETRGVCHQAHLWAFLIGEKACGTCFYNHKDITVFRSLRIIYSAGTENQLVPNP